MKSLKFIVRLSLFVLVLFAVAASTHAQQCPGYNPTMSQGSPSSASGVIPSSPCAGKSPFSTPSFYETNSLTDYCGSYDTGGYLSHTATVTGNGRAYCAGFVVTCEPYFYAYLTVATTNKTTTAFTIRLTTRPTLRGRDVYEPPLILVKTSGSAGGTHVPLPLAVPPTFTVDRGAHGIRPPARVKGVRRSSSI